MSFLSKLFGVGGASAPAPEAKPEEYKGFAIIPTPAREGSKYRIGARIEKDIDSEVKSHTLIRADTLDDLQEANSASIGKAKLMIDQMGDRLFNS